MFRTVTTLAALVLAASTVEARTKLLRFPDIHGDRVVFSHAGDLWTAPAGGGLATRLTAHPGVEMFAKFSPDGRWIAFTGQYDGDEQVYVVPAAGGRPTQLTFYPARGPLPARWGYDHQVYDWMPDGERVVFRAMQDGWSLTGTRLYTVSRDGGLPTPLPMPVSGAGDLSPDGRRIAYSPLVRDFRTWKRYQGGWAQDLYVFDLETHDLRRITDHVRTDRDPMWIGETIYFSSDRDGTLNLYAFDLDDGGTRQLTRSTRWDVRWPSDDGERRIVYELDGELEIYDVQDGSTRRISIEVPNDGVAMRPSRIPVEEWVEDFGLGPDGKRALFVARGDVFTAPIEKGPTRNLTHSSGAHDKWARWSPDGKKVAFVSDRDGEDEIWLVAQDGGGQPEQLTDGSQAMLYAPEWSPDGKRLAFSDKDGKLYVLALADRKKVEIADEPQGQLTDHAWSPDGGHLAFSVGDRNGQRSLWLWSVGTGRAVRVNDDTFSEYGPAWGPDGDYLYYLSDRAYAPQIGTGEWNFVADRTVGIFAMALRKDVAHPFPPESDEVEVDGQGKDEDDDEKEERGKDGDEDDEDDEDEDGKKKDEKPDPVRIDLDGLGQRTTRVPIEADNYEDLVAIDGHLLYVRDAPFFYGREADVKPELRIFSFEKRKVETLAEDIDGYAVAADGKHVLVRHDDAYKLYDAKFEGRDEPKAVSTGGLMADRVPAEEWRQIFDEVWRRFRDFFYVSNMHGYDWKALGDQYRPLLEHVAHRSDLNYVLGEMISELNVGHAYIAGGDWELPDRPSVALPGARFELDPTAGLYRIAKIFRGQNEEDRYRSPLTEIGVTAAEGDWVLAIDGEELGAGDNPYRLLRHKGDRPVTLTLNDRPRREGAREVTFQPIESETDLLYLDMVLTNRARVDELSDGRVGYIHLPDMGSNGIQEFIKWYYPQLRKEGLVVDVRSNGGGNVSQMIIERLDRELLGTRFARTNEWPTTYPAATFHGHMACILDANSASDGDIFPHMFRKAGLGPLIGKRSWGGVIGITNRGPLIDGGSVNVPEFGTNDVDGRWVIEGHGVDPDVEVDNDPASVLAGRDLQLETAVADVLRRIREDAKRLPDRPAPPVKTGTR
jgi:tricorn protease